mmetsp:Transcript_31245/g.56116  ORF Transcript_31245/g.56116 Transcript_31245/m.56116 type:complete len:202 (+) Transcript_31245:369-974(+)
MQTCFSFFASFLLLWYDPPHSLRLANILERAISSGNRSDSSKYTSCTHFCRGWSPPSSVRGRRRGSYRSCITLFTSLTTLATIDPVLSEMMSAPWSWPNTTWMMPPFTPTSQQSSGCWSQPLAKLWLVPVSGLLVSLSLEGAEGDRVGELGRYGEGGGDGFESRLGDSFTVSQLICWNFRLTSFSSCSRVASREIRTLQLP